ncbi:MAG: hypothetical protein CL959_01535 [Euryarchaeota archaeon]|nr:hypothetical protein [Euryarchaeota archaeon]|tara:strand:- start:2131 stop:2547 length:417 start_codon:yes stop_codon:yes gene_type:complete
MALRAAEMGRCARKCRCQKGENQGLAYDCAQPCEAGYVFVSDECDCSPIDGKHCVNGSLTLTSWIQPKGGIIQKIETFYPLVSGYIAGGLTRVLDDTIEAYDGEGWIQIGVTPYRVGDDFDGHMITNVVCQVVANPNC